MKRAIAFVAAVALSLSVGWFGRIWWIQRHPRFQRVELTVPVYRVEPGEETPDSVTESVWVGCQP